jgi:hypothetical protein
MDPAARLMHPMRPRCPDLSGLFFACKKEKEPKRKKYYPKNPFSDLYIL